MNRYSQDLFRSYGLRVGDKRGAFSSHFGPRWVWERVRAIRVRRGVPIRYQDLWSFRKWDMGPGSHLANFQEMFSRIKILR